MTERIRTWLAATAVYRQPRVFAFLFFGFASGLPLALTGETLRFWFTDAGIDLGLIGLTSLIGTAYTIKFLWAPIVDHVTFGRWGRAFGRRRSWMIATQIGIGLLVLALSTLHPAENLMLAVSLCIGVAFLSATQDIAVDAYRIERLDVGTLGAGTAMHTGGWYLGARLAGGALALGLMEQFDWHVSYAIMGLLMTVGIAAVLTNGEPEQADQAASAEERARQAEVERFVASRPALRGATARVLGFLYVSVVSPFLDMAKRNGRLLVPLLLLVIFFKFQDAFAQVMTGPFVRGELHFTGEEIASVYKIFGLGASFLGIFTAGLLIRPLGLMRSLWIGAILQMLSNFGFCILVVAGHDLFWLAATNGFENFASGIGNTVFVVFLSRLCSAAYTATQYALLSAIAAIARTFMAAPAGYLVEYVGWFDFFIISGLSAIPGLILIWILSRSRFAAGVRAEEERTG